MTQTVQRENSPHEFCKELLIMWGYNSCTALECLLCVLLLSLLQVL